MHPTVLTAPERFDAFVSMALKKGIGEICVTDHMPLSISRASDRLVREGIADYCARVRELARRYEGQIRIKCGIEIDYHPSVISEIEYVLGEGDFDYILGSSHMHVFVKDMNGLTYNDFARLAIENSILCAQSGAFDTLSHPDMFRFAFTNAKRFPLTDDGYAPEKHADLWSELLDTVKEKGMRLEINPHLAEKHGMEFVYPMPTVVEWALQRGIGFTYGSDAHAPESVGALIDELEAHPIYGRAIRLWESE